jgi:hypothetical protein
MLEWQIDGTGSEWIPMAALVLAVLQLLVRTTELGDI